MPDPDRDRCATPGPAGLAVHRPRILAVVLLTGPLTASVSALALDSDSDGLDDAVETHTGVFVSASDTGSDPLGFDTDGDGSRTAPR
jgi:hypothetical protein